MLKKLGKKVNKKVLSVFTALFVLGLPVIASADSGQSTAVVSALETVASDIKATITSIAPVALSIAGVFLVWRYGMRFFKSISK